MSGSPVPARVSLAALTGLIPVALAGWVYWPITRSWFWSDDFVHMASIVDDGFTRFVFRPFGGHNLLARNVIFYSWWHLFGLDPAPYYWTAYLTHLLNVWLLFRVLRTLTSSATLACFGAALWGTSPIVAGTLGWYSVFGQELVATILLVVLGRVVALRRTGEPVPARSAWTWYVLLLVGTTCFGVGLGAALAFPVALFLLVPAAWCQPWLRAAYLALPAVTVLVYLAFRRLYPLLIEPLPPEEVFGAGPAGIGELARVARLVGAQVAFAASEYPRSFLWAGRAYPDRFSAPVLLLVALALGLGAARGRWVWLRAALGLASLSLGVYLAIAVGRVNLESAALPLLRLASQLRYHYVGGIPIILLACVSLHEASRLAWFRRLPRAPLLLAVLALGAWAYARSSFRIESNLRAKATFEASLRIVEQEAALRPGVTVYIENGVNPRALLGPGIPNALFPGRAAIFMLAHDDDRLDGRTVRFVERDPTILARYRQRPASRLHRLLVPPGAEGRAP